MNDLQILTCLLSDKHQGQTVKKKKRKRKDEIRKCYYAEVKLRKDDIQVLAYDV